MKDFKLNNLRQLTTEEQIRLNGGVNPGPCDVKCSCTCYCKCDNRDPKSPADDSSYNTGDTYTSAAKQREAMNKW